MSENTKTEEIGTTGYGEAVLRGPDGEIKQRVEFKNLITDKGDEYYSKKAAVSVGDYGSSAPTAVNGMKLGTGTTAAAKSGAGSSIVTYISGSNNALDASSPTCSAVGTDVGWYIIYTVTWAAGDATNAAIAEVALVNDQASDDIGSAAETYARAVLSSTVDKAAGDSLTIVWRHKFLGAV